MTPASDIRRSPPLDVAGDLDVAGEQRGRLPDASHRCVP
jgi:hypothetical protein